MDGGLTAPPWKQPPFHAIHGRSRHTAARWASKFNANEQGVGTHRRRLEFLERGGATGRREQVSPTALWAPKAKLIDTYNAKAVTLLKGSGFVEAFHLIKAAIELSLVGEGIGAMPEGRGNLLTALSLNNLGCYHRRRGQGRQAVRLLLRAEEIEGPDVSVSTQCNLCVILSDLGALAHAYERAQKLMRRVQQQTSEGHPLPPDRAAVVAVLLYNVGVDLHHLDLEQRGLRSPQRLGTQAFHLGTEHHPDLDFQVTRDGAGRGRNWDYHEHHSAFRAASASKWCLSQSAKVVGAHLGPAHPISAALMQSAGPFSSSLIKSAPPPSLRPLGAMSPPPSAGPAGWSHGGAAWPPSTAKLSVDDGDGPLAAPPPSLIPGKLSTDDGGPEVVRSDKPLHKLGRTLLGQRVDGTTVSIGWPNFTLIDLW